MITGPTFIGPHAVAQFQARIAPLTYEAARAAILTELRDHVVSVRASAIGRGVVARTRGGRYAFRAVLGAGTGSRPAVVTILRSGR